MTEWIMKTKKKISFIIPYLIFLIIITLLIWGQTRDEKILPNVQEQFSYIIPKTNIPNEQNAFIAMAGFNVLNPKDMVTEGYDAIRKTVKQTEETPFEYNIKFNIVKSPKKDLTHLYQLPCDSNFINNRCLDDISIQANLIKQLIQDQQSFITNYIVLQQFSEFARILPANVDSSLPYQYISNSSQLLTANAILDIKAGNIDKGMRFLINDIKFYRNMLSSKLRNLEDTTVFVNTLLQHYFVLDRLLHSGINLKPFLSELTPLLQPLSIQERSLVEALDNERNYHLVVQVSLGNFYFYTGHNNISGCYNNSCAFGRYPSRLIYKFNETLNATYLDWQPVIDFAKTDYPLDNNFLEKLKVLQEIEKKRHTNNIARLYERYGLFLFKNYAGEKQKNSIYYADGYTMNFTKIYLLNNVIEQLNITLQKIY